VECNSWAARHAQTRDGGSSRHQVEKAGGDDVQLATANIWGLPAPLSWPPRHVRFARVGEYLRHGGRGPLDVVLLQEHWRLPGRPHVLSDLGLVAPCAHDGDSGLALYTRHPVLERVHGTFRTPAARMLDALWSRKGWQRVVVDVDGVRVAILNTHLEAYPWPKHARVRADQIDELLALADRVPGPVVLAGDFNVYADVASDRSGLARIAAAGFVDVVATFDTTPTYDRGSECERFDRVFVRGLQCTAAHVDMHARLADHRPVVVELVPEPRALPRGAA
jgi:endonuclease/exonuclease/phosphatase (EEP) superfamily protein YafD